MTSRLLGVVLSLNRAGFGGTAEEIDKVLKLGPMDAADWLMDFPDAPAEEQRRPLAGGQEGDVVALLRWPQPHTPKDVGEIPKP